MRSSKLDIASVPPTTTTTRDHSAGLRLAAPVRFALRVLVSTDRHPRRYSADRSDDRESEKNRDRHHRWATRHQELTIAAPVPAPTSIPVTVAPMTVSAQRTVQRGKTKEHIGRRLHSPDEGQVPAIRSRSTFWRIPPWRM